MMRASATAIPLLLMLAPLLAQAGEGAPSEVLAPGDESQGTTLPIEDPIRKPVPRPDGKGSVLVLDFASNDAEAQRQAKAFEELVETRLSLRPGARVLGAEQARFALGPEKEKLLECAETSCLAEFCSAVGVRYLLRGRLDRFGTRYVVVTSVLDSKDPLVVVRAREDVEMDAALLRTADRMADGIAEAVGLPRPEEGKKPADPNEPLTHLNLKLGHMLPLGGTFDWRTFKFEVETDYYLTPTVPVFFEVGMILGRSDGENQGSFAMVPLTLGLKYVFMEDWKVRPYTGLGMGLSFLKDLVDPSAKIGLHFNGLFGLAYMPWKHLGFNLETTFNFDGVKLSNGSDISSAFSYNFGVIGLY